MSSFSADLPPHLVALVPAQWAAWRWFVLRGAGFPAAMAGRLAQPLCAAAADNVIQAEIEAENQIQTAVRALNEALDRFTAEGVQRHDQRFIALLNARRRLTSGKIPESYDPAGGLAETVGAIKLALARRDHLRLEFERLFLAGIEQQSAVLQSFASDPRFREAILWQNQHAFQNAIQPVARTQCGDTRNQRQRNHEELVASYAQRYCVKNDTIGFFGPVSWGRIEDDGDVIEIGLGASLIKSRQTYFESWAVDKIAASLSLLEGMAWWIPPRLLPDVYLENGLLHRAGVPPVGVTGLEFAALRLCDGKALPEDILRAVQDDARFKAIGQSSLRELLKAHTSKGNLVWRFLVPVEVNCEVSLRKQLNRIGDAELRERATRQLDQLEGARADVANAAGDPEQLNHALSKAEQTFAAITNTPGLRNAGATYGGRTILYEDCQRDIALRITPELLSPVLPALSLLLQSLRWLMQSMALEFHRLFRQTLSEISGAGGCPEIRLLAWWLYTEPKLLNASSLADVDQLFRKKWAEILPVNPDKTAIYLKSGDLKEKIDSLFPEHGPGFYPVRYFCPDLMLAGASVEDIKHGNLLYVLGEVHSGKNTLCHAALVEQHPDRLELVEATKWDLSSACFKILNTHETATTTVRTSEGFLRPDDFLVATTADAVAPSGFDSHAIADLVLQEEEEQLYAIHQPTGRRFHILEAFSDLLFMFVMNKATWIQPMPHAPRVLIDQLVIHRETWRFTQDQLAFAREKDESMRFLGARRWMNKHGIPRRTFIKTVSEIKPFYLDLDSPVLVENFCRAVRRMNPPDEKREEITVSEMLPTTEQLWLKDSAGASYTSELRFAIVDLMARSFSQMQDLNAPFGRTK